MFIQYISSAVGEGDVIGFLQCKFIFQVFFVQDSQLQETSQFNASTSSDIFNSYKIDDQIFINGRIAGKYISHNKFKAVFDPDHSNQSIPNKTDGMTRLSEKLPSLSLKEEREVSENEGEPEVEDASEPSEGPKMAPRKPCEFSRNCYRLVISMKFLVC